MRSVYIGTFLIAMATLAFEVALVRLLSVISWYHMAFFAVSSAMLGMTAGAITVYVAGLGTQEQRRNDTIAASCLGFAVAAPLSLFLLCYVPISGDFDISPAQVRTTLLKGLLATVFCVIPFYASGIAITTILTRVKLPIGTLYASDLAGAAIGCLIVLAGLEILTGPALILVTGAIGAVAALFFLSGGGSRAHKQVAWAVLVFLVLLAGFAAAFPLVVRPLVVKGRYENPQSVVYERWNSFSRITVYGREVAGPAYWGPSRVAPVYPIARHQMVIDGGAGTYLTECQALDSLFYLKYDLTNLAYYLRRSGGALVIGVGAGRDLQSALLFGHERVKGVEINPIFVDLLKTRYADFSGLGRRPDVEMVVDEARSYLTRDTSRYALVQMSLIDTWAATGAGAFSLSENGLYTTEAWSVFLSRLRDDGIFTVSRWYNPENPGETGRMLSLAVSALWRRGTMDPSRHIALVTNGSLATLLVGAAPLSETDLTILGRACQLLQYDIVAAPGIVPQDPALRRILAAGSPRELAEVVRDEPLNFAPPTDESPYFFNMLKLDHLDYAFQWNSGVVRGNLIANLTLIALLVSLAMFAIATILVPLVVRRAAAARGGQGRAEISWSAAAYFSLIGAGFMLTQIALIQRLSVYLGHPVYALGVLLFTMIAAASAGSLLSERIPVTRREWFLAYPTAVAAALMLASAVTGRVAGATAAYPVMAKVLVSVALVAPVAALMGVCFPAGMRLLGRVDEHEAPWYWGLNGIFGVLCSALAVFLSIYSSITTSLVVAAACYAALLVCVPGMARRRELQERAATDAPRRKPRRARVGRVTTTSGT